MELSSMANTKELLEAVQNISTMFIASLKNGNKFESPSWFWKFLTAKSAGKFRNDAGFNACVRSHSQFLLDHFEKAVSSFSGLDHESQEIIYNDLDSEHRLMIKLDRRNPRLKRLAELPVLDLGSPASDEAISEGNKRSRELEERIVIIDRIHARFRNEGMVLDELLQAFPDIVCRCRFLARGGFYQTCDTKDMAEQILKPNALKDILGGLAFAHRSTNYNKVFQIPTPSSSNDLERCRTVLYWDFPGDLSPQQLLTDWAPYLERVTRPENVKGFLLVCLMKTKDLAETFCSNGLIWKAKRVVGKLP